MICVQTTKSARRGSAFDIPGTPRVRKNVSRVVFQNLRTHPPQTYSLQDPPQACCRLSQGWETRPPGARGRCSCLIMCYCCLLGEPPASPRLIESIVGRNRGHTYTTMYENVSIIFISICIPKGFLHFRIEWCWIDGHQYEFRSLIMQAFLRQSRRCLLLSVLFWPA